MNNEQLLYIEDAHKRKLFYRFTPAAFASNFVPLVVVLDDKEKSETLNFEYKMWNVLTPIDTFSDEDSGISWLGEAGDFYVKELLQELIEQIADAYECEEHIYLYGNSTGSYGAVLHGVLCKANAVYVKAPRIRLRNHENAKENDLSSLLNPDDSFPIFYLDNNKSSLEDEVVGFVDICKKYGINVHLDFCPDSKEDDTYTLKKVLDMFEHVPPEQKP